VFCPNCGAERQSAKSYCKRCGEWLPDLKAGRTKWGGETPAQHLKIMLYLSGFSALAALFSAILLYVTQLPGISWPVGLAAALLISISAWQISSFSIGLKLRARLKRGREDVAREINAGAAQNVPALNATDTSQLVGTQSVTENTTELLEPLTKRTREEKS
jgi:hypothetical protein